MLPVRADVDHPVPEQAADRRAATKALMLTRPRRPSAADDAPVGPRQVVVAALAVVQVAKHRYKVPMAIARVNDPRNEEIFRVLGVDAPT